jgi:RNA recognition motif-containing protein
MTMTNSVYISNLPCDATDTQLLDVMKEAGPVVSCLYVQVSILLKRQYHL